MNGPLSLLIAYLLGAIPFGYWIALAVTGKDVRSMGSGNIGATNVGRTAGKKLGILTLALDIGKGVLAVYLASLTGDRAWMALAALAACAGHVFPVFLKFKGGKAVATFAGAFGFLLPMALVATMGVFIVALLIWRYVSLASILGAAVFPVAAYLLLHPPVIELVCSSIACLLIIYRHNGNIQRLRDGKESRWPK